MIKMKSKLLFLLSSIFPFVVICEISNHGQRGQFSLYESLNNPRQSLHIHTTTSTTTTIRASTLNYEESNIDRNEELEENDDDDEEEVEENSSVRRNLIQELLSINQEKEGEIRLVDGKNEYEGNVEIFHNGRWGSICDDEWDEYEAMIVCKELGFGKAKRHTHSSQFGYTRRLIWMDNLYCYGTENKLADCRFDGWGTHDCERTEGAGVICMEAPPPPTIPPPTTTPKPKTKILHKSMRVRIRGGRVPSEGRVEVAVENRKWETVCGDGWGLREAMVVCRELGMNFAQSAVQTHLFSSTSGFVYPSSDDELEHNNMTDSYMTNPILSGLTCKGNEKSLSECLHDQSGFCPGSGRQNVAGVVCVDYLADLIPDLYALMSSAHLEDKQIYLLQCAMEENCLASEAYRLRNEHPHYHTEARRLLRFTTSIENIGNGDFRPFIQKSHWIWHGCHAHYHSMEVFAHFDILDTYGKRVAEGHKASFCLEDNECVGVEAKYDCENYGDQGITPGCKDIYYYNIDCQWIDVTELPFGTYTFRMAINPEYKVAEQSFENNAALCLLVYTQQYAVINNCSLTRP